MQRTTLRVTMARCSTSLVAVFLVFVAFSCALSAAKTVVLPTGEFIILFHFVRLNPFFFHSSKLIFYVIVHANQPSRTKASYLYPITNEKTLRDKTVEISPFYVTLSLVYLRTFLLRFCYVRAINAERSNDCMGTPKH